MSLPACHIVYYKNFAIHYLNGIYKVINATAPFYVSMNDAKKEVDRLDNILNNIISEPPSTNLKQANASQTPNGNS